MIVNELPGLVLALAVGIGLGVVFFGGLWLTLLKLPASRWPTLLMLGSLVGRTAITLAGFYLVMDGNWQRLLACVLGFVLARQLLIRRFGPVQVVRPATVRGKHNGYQP
jgi:F1F0 ATPase subunit 2